MQTISKLTLPCGLLLAACYLAHPLVPPAHAQGLLSVSESAPPKVQSPLRVTDTLADGISVRWRFDEPTYRMIRGRSRVSLIDFPLSAEVSVELELEQFTVYDNETVIVSSGGSGEVEIAVPDLVLLKGNVKGEARSTVFLGLSPFGTNGLVHIDSQLFLISTDTTGWADGSPLAGFVCERSQLPASEEPDGFVPCQPIRPMMDEQGDPDYSNPLRGPLQSYIAEVALDAELSYYDLMDRNLESAIVYLLQLTAGAGVMIERDLDTKLWVTYLRIWTTAAPFEGGSHDDFRAFWNANMTHIDRDFASRVFFSTTFGGMAGVKSLCNLTSAYASMGVYEGSFPQPITPGTPWWDLKVVAHEWGHILGSDHTHCYDPPIDSCYNTEPSCYSGSEICRRGTIMSYCHQCDAAGTGVIDPEFHPVVIDTITNWLPSCACLDVTLDECYVDVANTGSEDGSPDHPWSTFSEGARMVSPGGTIWVKPGIYAEDTLRVFPKAMVRRWGASGSVILGQ